MVKTDVWGNELYVKVPEPEPEPEKEFKIDDRIEQAYRQGYTQGHKKSLDGMFSDLYRTHPRTAEFIKSHQFTGAKTANDLKDICERFFEIGITPSTDSLMYVKLACLEDLIAGDENAKSE